MHAKKREYLFSMLSRYNSISVCMLGKYLAWGQSKLPYLTTCTITWLTVVSVLYLCGVVYVHGMLVPSWHLDLNSLDFYGQLNIQCTTYLRCCSHSEYPIEMSASCTLNINLFTENLCCFLYSYCSQEWCHYMVLRVNTFNGTGVL